MFKKLKNNITEENCILTKEDVEVIKQRALVLQDLIYTNVKKGNLKLARTYANELSFLVKKVKKYEEYLKKNSLDS